MDYLLKALPSVIKQFPDFRLYVLGKGKEEKKLRQLADEIGIYNNVKFLGHQPAEKVKQYIDKSRVLVLPSHSEGLGRIALEAMARARPVIGSHVEGIKETVTEERGYPVPPADSDAIATKLLEVLIEKDIAREKGEAGRNYIQANYSIDKYKDNYEELFNFVQ